MIAAEGSPSPVEGVRLESGPSPTDIQNFVQDFVWRRLGSVPKTCWIAHVREMNWLPTRRTWNRPGRSRQEPCPVERRVPIERTFRHLGLI
jgi:hypothetical protein